MYSKHETVLGANNYTMVDKMGFELPLDERMEWTAKLRLWRVLNGADENKNMCSECFNARGSYGCPQYTLSDFGVYLSKGDILIITYLDGRLWQGRRCYCREWIRYV